MLTKSLYEQQLELEYNFKALGEELCLKGYEAAREEKEGDIAATSLGQKFLGYQFEEVKGAIRNFVEVSINTKRGTKGLHMEALEKLLEVYSKEPEKLYDLMTFTAFSTLFNQALRKQHHLSNLSQEIGKMLFEEAQLEKYLQEHPEQEFSTSLGLKERIRAKYKRAYATAKMSRDNFSFGAWDTISSMALGNTLIQIVVAKSTYFEIIQGAMLEIVPTQALLEAWLSNEKFQVESSYRFCPCIIAPIPWTNYTNGGYHGELQAAVKLLRLHDTKTIYSDNYLKKLNQVELSATKQAINAIQATPWKINAKVLEVLECFIAQGGGKAGLPYFDLAPAPAKIAADASEEEVKVYKKEMIKYWKGNTKRVSLCMRVTANQKVARQYSKYDRIYFPCNMDFRGRVYPIPSFNFQGDDVNKGLLLFADAPACINMQAIEWLMVEGANLAGVDKVSYADRKQWVLDNEAAILASAEDAIGTTFWQVQDEPWQFLSFCFEWARWKAWELLHGTPEGFVVEIPIAFDGTCSGLQHFSAILRDEVGGAAVNLIPSDKPQDIYGVVAAKVNLQLAEDAKRGTEDNPVKEDKRGGTFYSFGTKSLAQQWLVYGVDRKVTKRNVMTLAYGSKAYGFKEQLYTDIVKIDIEENTNSVFTDSRKQAAGYLGKVIWEAVGTTVIKAVEGMKWLQECAKECAKERQVVSWTTPAGLPIQQHYMEVDSRSIQLRCMGKHIRLYSKKVSGNIDKRKQGSGIAPNFIHSMDACHLQLTTCNCVRRGIKHFAMIHDSYGCPAAQAQEMYEAVRESFIDMYEENDVLELFRADLQMLTKNTLPKPPSKGTLDLECVRSSKYIFS